jgi:predicted nucleotidyltransferase
MSELTNVMDPHSRLRQAVEQLVASAPVEKIILFGSRARGDNHEHSDYDICVILNDTAPPGVFTPLSMWRTIADVGLAIQILPIRHSAFEMARHDVNSISHDIDQDGRVIYESAGVSFAP